MICVCGNRKLDAKVIGIGFLTDLWQYSCQVCGWSKNLTKKFKTERMNMGRARVAVQDTMEGTDTDLSLLCDQLLEDRENTSVARAEEHATECKLIEVMKSKGKKSIKHSGKTFRVSHQEEKDKLQIVSE